MKMLFVTFNDVESGTYGGSQCSARNRMALQKTADVDTYMIRKISTLQSVKSIICGYFPPLNQKHIQEILQRIDSERYEIVFLDSSLLGDIAAAVRKKFPKVKIVTFCHNVELDYIDVRFQRGIKRNIYYKLARKAEELCVRLSDRMIALNRRDRERLDDLYGRQADILLPISFEDRITDEQLMRTCKKSDRKTGLFLGAFGRSNYEGIKWFVEEVSGKIDADIQIAGKGFERVADELTRKNVKVVGMVDDVSEVYLDADFVIAPILFGGGMKVKIAEAMMYGKTIFGTEEAFEGYDVDLARAGALCKTAEDFVQAINAFVKEDQTSLNIDSRTFFKEKYSTEVTDVIVETMIRDME